MSTFLSRQHGDWLGNIRGDMLAGLVVALALIPEAIAFSIIAGVDPKVGLYASFSIAVITAITGVLEAEGRSIDDFKSSSHLALLLQRIYPFMKRWVWTGSYHCWLIPRMMRPCVDLKSWAPCSEPAAKHFATNL